MKKYNIRQSVEIFHILFLSYLSRKVDKRLFSLKGGCNMRFYFNSIRYSEDMDIDIQIINKETLTKNVNQILKSLPFQLALKANGLDVESVSNPKSTEVTQRWKIQLKSSSSVMPINTKIEFSRRNFDDDVKFELINADILHQYSLPAIMSNHYSKNTMYEQKIVALALRAQVQSRDIFDLFLLIGSGGVTTHVLSSDTRGHVIQAINNANSVVFADFKSQVISYLPPEYHEQYNSEDVWTNVVKTVTRQLEISL